MKSASTQTETLTMKERMKGYRPKFRQGGGGCLPKPTNTKAKASTVVAAPAGNSNPKKIGCFPKRFTCGGKQQHQQHQQNGGETKTNSPPSVTLQAAPQDEMRQEPNVIEIDGVQAPKMEDELLSEERTPADETEQEKGLHKDFQEAGELSTVAEQASVDKTPASNNCDDKVEDTVEERGESKDDVPQPEQQKEAVDEVNIVPSEEPSKEQAEDSREVINPTTNIMENAMGAMESAMCTFTNALETAMSSLSSQKGGGADEQQDKQASDSPPEESQKEVTAEQDDNHLSAPLERQASIKREEDCKDEETSGSSNNINTRPPLMPSLVPKRTTKDDNIKSSLKGNPLKNLKSSLTRSNKEEPSGPDSVKSWPMTRKQKSMNRFRKSKIVAGRRKSLTSSAAADATEKELQRTSNGNENNAKLDDEDEEGSTKGENSTLDTTNTLKGQEPMATNGIEDANADIPKDVDVIHSSRDEIEATIIQGPDDVLFNRTHSLSSRGSQKEEKEETPSKNDANDAVVVNRTLSHSGSQKSKGADKVSQSNDVTAASMAAIGSVVSLFMRSLAKPQKESNVDSDIMTNEDNAEEPVQPTTVEEKGDNAPCKEPSISDGDIHLSQTPLQTLSKSDSQKDKDKTTDNSTRDSNKNEAQASVAMDQPATPDQDQQEAPVNDETTDTEIEDRAIEIATSEKDTQNMDGDTPELGDNYRSSPLLQEQQQKAGALEDIIVTHDSGNGPLADVVASMLRKLSTCSTQPIGVELLSGDEDESPIQALRVLPSATPVDSREQRQEIETEKAGSISHSGSEHKETSNHGSKEAEEDADSKSSNIDNNAPVMRSELLEGKVNFCRTDSNISSISVDNKKNVNTVIIQKTQQMGDKDDEEEEEEEEDEDREQGPVCSSEDSREEVIIDATRKFTANTYTMVNRERKKQALGELRRSTYLDSLATSHAIVMAELLTLGHSVDSLSALQEQLHSDDVGENIQRGKDEREMHKLAMEAGTSSRYNILRPTYRQYGMGTAVGEDGMVYMVQLFRGPVKEDVHQVERGVEPSSVWCSTLWC